jgi:hypothetical protein
VGAAQVADVIRELGPSRNLFPALDPEDLLGPRTRGLELEDVFLAVEGSKILGMLARWKQTAFKQVRVIGYPTRMRLLRPFINVGSKLTRRPYVPAAGELMNMVYMSLPLVREERTDVFAQLLAHVAGTLETKTHCMLGLCENDPLLAAVRFPAHKERFCLYLVSPEYKAPSCTRVPYVEAATL